MNYLQQRAAALGRAREIAEAAKACNRALTATGAASAALDVIPTAVGTTEALHGLTPGALVVNPVDLGTGAAGRFLVPHSPLRIRWSPQEVRRKSAESPPERSMPSCLANACQSVKVQVRPATAAIHACTERAGVSAP